MTAHRSMRHLRKAAGAAAVVTALVTSVVTSGVAGAAPSSKAASFGLVTSGTLTIANFGSETPELTIKGNKIGGIDGDLLTAFAKKYGLKIKLFNTSFASTILAVQQHKADVAVNFYWTTARGQTVKFGTPYYADISVVIVNKKAIPHYTGPSSLTGKKMGNIVGTVYEPVTQAYFPADDITVYPGIPEAGKALLNGQIDAMLDSSSEFNAPPLAGAKGVAEYPIEKGQFGLPDGQLTFPNSNIVGCDNSALNSALNAQLKSMQKSGAWDKVLKKYGAATPYTTYPAPTGGCNG